MSFFDIFRRRSGDGVSGRKRPGALGSFMRSMFGGSIIGAAKQTRLESSWSTTPHTADAYIYQHLQTICARSRIGCEDYDHLRKYISLIKNNVPGPNGFRLTSCPIDPNGKVDREAAKAIMRSFKQWSKPKNFDFSGRISRAEAERLAMATVGKDGEVIGLIHTGIDAGPWGFSVELLDPMLLNPRHFERLTNGNVVRHGIEFPKDGGRPIAYHFIEQDEQQMGYAVSNRSTKRIEASRIIHWFIIEIVGQKRGLPLTRTALWRLRMLSGGEDAALTNFRVSAGKMGFFKSTGEDDEVDTDELPMDADPGSFENIGDRELQQWNPQFPDAAVEPFIRTMLRSASTGLLSSYHSISGDLTSVSFSSIRQGTLDDRGSYLAIQGSQEDGWCLPIFEAWLEYSLLAGKITLPSGRPLPFDKLEKYKEAIFTGCRWPWIDPSSEANAAQIMIGQKLRSRSDVIRDIGGRDPEEVWDEIESEDKELAARNIVPLVPPGAMPPDAAPKEKPDPPEPAEMGAVEGTLKTE